MTLKVLNVKHSMDCEPETCESKLTDCVGCFRHGIDECFCEVAEETVVFDDETYEGYVDIPTQEYVGDQEWWDLLLGGEG